MSIAHLVEILRYFYLHTVGDSLILLDTLIELVEVLVIRCPQEFHHHTKHTMDAIAETADFLLSLEDRKLWSLHDTRLDETQTEILIFLICLWFDKLANQLLYLRYKPDENCCITHIKTGVEHRQDDRQQRSFLGCRHISIRIISYQ